MNQKSTNIYLCAIVFTWVQSVQAWDSVAHVWYDVTVVFMVERSLKPCSVPHVGQLPITA